MSTGNDNRSLKQKKILDCALKIIRDHGDAGLTMRKIADCAGMRLSNVQYYFQSKDDVLAAMVSTYFGECEAELTQVAHSCESLGRPERTHRLISEVLKHGTELSDMCRVFRELWAISSRNDVVSGEMTTYYESLCRVVSNSIVGTEGSSRQKARVGSLLLPFVEGYSITASSLPMTVEEVADMLTELTLGLMDN
ncbi:MAG: TetR/AcrR family transcriptional regulator [Xanthomonadales bacterium]|nr:TetR/AcrR family transcriptional regulator [Xanthomonadales bacterium]